MSGISRLEIPDMDVLFIKTSSLGDVIHHFPALTEAKTRRPDARFAWVVEEAFAPLIQLHPALDLAIPIAVRQWRSAPLSPATWRGIARFRRALHRRSYDEVIDTQGLLFKSALIARTVRGRRHGYDADSIRERPACWLYDVRHRIKRNQHAIARNRALTGQALGYAPGGRPEFGLDRALIAETAAATYGVLLHSTARPEKQWPEDNWRRVAASLGASIDLVVPFGTSAERARAARIALAAPRARVPERRPIDAMARLIAGASFVVGVDTGLLHLAAALGVPLVAVFCASEPGLTGPVGNGPIVVLGSRASEPSVPEVIDAIAAIRPR
jgi:heptosyltransferase-1